MQPTTRLEKRTAACRKCRRPETIMKAIAVVNALFNIVINEQPDGKDCDELIHQSFNQANTYDTICPARTCHETRRVTEKNLLDDPKDLLVCNLGRLKYSGRNSTFRQTKINRRIPLGGPLQLPTCNGTNITFEIIGTIQHVGSVDSGKSFHFLHSVLI